MDNIDRAFLGTTVILFAILIGLMFFSLKLRLSNIQETVKEIQKGILIFHST